MFLELLDFGKGQLKNSSEILKNDEWIKMVFVGKLAKLWALVLKIMSLNPFFGYDFLFVLLFLAR